MFNLLKFQTELQNSTTVLTVISIVFLVGIFAPDAKAQISTSSNYQVTPFNLFNLAYQGYFRQDGIDSGSQAGSVEPEMLVRAAIKHHWLPEQTISDKAYLYGLNIVINGFNIDS